MSFGILPGHTARQLDVEKDRPALLTLGRQCEEYIALALGRTLPPGEVPGALVQMLKPKTVPVERSFVFGLYPEHRENGGKPRHLQGILYFLYPPPQPGTWFLTLMLLAPVVRGQGLGQAFHRAFAHWAGPRGADRLVVAVAENNPRARNFWQNRIGYTPVVGWTHGANPELELRLGPARSSFGRRGADA